ncbi:MAG: hypothetical protein JWO03_1802 [Bacteroidetes bacterium]|nr:hypothetical protein [Bacteroidota bacterium]
MNISEILGRINENTRLLNEGRISEIEKDILLGDLRELYTLVKGQNPVEKPAITIPPVAEVHEAVAPSVVEKVEPVIVQEVKPEPVVVPAPEPIIEIKKEAPAVIAEEQKEEPIHLETKRIHYHEGSPVRGPRTSSLNEVFVGEERSINTLVGGAEKKRALNDHIAGKDLNSMIDLNKKHVLTNELFQGDTVAFQAAISYINISPTIEVAFEYIKTELLPKYKWTGDMQATKLFDKLVRQKFGV